MPFLDETIAEGVVILKKVRVIAYRQNSTVAQNEKESGGQVRNGDSPTQVVRRTDLTRHRTVGQV